MTDESSLREKPCAILTGKERDPESGLDYFGARYYSGPHGRFTSPDPVSLSSKHLAYPQRWNAYAYVRNNPLALVDPDGADDFYVFRPLADSTGPAWRAIQDQAGRYGHTVRIMNSESTTVDWKEAVKTPNAHVIGVFHTGDDPRTQMAGTIQFRDGIVGPEELFVGGGETGKPVQFGTPVSEAGV